MRRALILALVVVGGVAAGQPFEYAYRLGVTNWSTGTFSCRENYGGATTVLGAVPAGNQANAEAACLTLSEADFESRFGVAASAVDETSRVTVAPGVYQAVNWTLSYAEEPPPPPPPPTDPEGWTCATEASARGGTFCVRETAEDTYDASYTSRCGGSASAFGMTWEEFEDFADQAADALFAECDDPLEPMPPDDPAVACTGTEGVACESTLQDVRYLLSLLVQLQQQQAQQPGPVMPDAPDPEGLYVPPFDRSQPSWEGFTEPNVTDDERGALTARIGELTDELVLEAEGRLPFGLGGVVVLPTIGEAPPCTELELTLFDTSRELGWCDSAAESWLATVGRTLTLAVLTIAFGFAIVRTVAWA